MRLARLSLLAPKETFEIAYVLSGEMDVQIGAGPIRHVRPGDTFEVDRDVPQPAIR